MRSLVLGSGLRCCARNVSRLPVTALWRRSGSWQFLLLMGLPICERRLPDKPSLHRVLIVARTVAGRGVCIGAMDGSGKARRLVPGDGPDLWNWRSADAPFRVGELWELSYVERPAMPPHVEDVVVSTPLPPEPLAVYSLAEVKRAVEKRAVVWEGPLDGRDKSAPFNGSVKIFRNLHPTLFSAKRDGSPVEFGSVGFWRPPYELVRVSTPSSMRFRFPVTQDDFRDEQASIIFKGDSEPPRRITSADLVRLSLVRSHSSSGEESAELLSGQLSGVFPATGA